MTTQKVTLITGGASGLGEAIVRRLAADGAIVVIADIDMKSPHALCAEIGDNSMVLELDVSQERDWVAYKKNKRPFLGRFTPSHRSTAINYRG